MTDKVVQVILAAARERGLVVSNPRWYYRVETRRNETVWNLHLALPQEDTAFTAYIAHTFCLFISFVAPHPEPVVELPSPHYVWLTGNFDVDMKSTLMFVSEARAALAAYAQQCAEVLEGKNDNV